MQANPKCTTGESQNPRYAFYDKNKDASNNGWVWFHRDLNIEVVSGFYRDQLQLHLGNGIPDGQGFVSAGESLVVYRYFPAGKDDRGRDHWVLLLAWLPPDTAHAAALKTLENEVFKHVETDIVNIPPQLSDFDYRKDCVKLMFDGGQLEVDSHKTGRDYIEKIIHCGAVNIFFYREKPNGKALICTQKKAKSQG
jgi:hypothetical protein